MLIDGQGWMHIALETRQNEAYCGSLLERGPFINFYHNSQMIIHKHNIMLSAGKNQFNIDDFKSRLASNLGQIKQFYASTIYMNMHVKLSKYEKLKIQSESSNEDRSLGSRGEGSIHIHPFTMKTFIDEGTPRLRNIKQIRICYGEE